MRGQVLQQPSDLRVAFLRQEFVDELTLSNTLKEELLKACKDEQSLLKEIGKTERKVERIKRRIDEFDLSSEEKQLKWNREKEESLEREKEDGKKKEKKGTASTVVADKDHETIEKSEELDDVEVDGASEEIDDDEETDDSGYEDVEEKEEEGEDEDEDEEDGYDDDSDEASKEDEEDEEDDENNDESLEDSYDDEEDSEIDPDLEDISDDEDVEIENGDSDDNKEEEEEEDDDDDDDDDDGDEDDEDEEENLTKEELQELLSDSEQQLQELEKVARETGAYNLEVKVKKIMNSMGFDENEENKLVSAFSGGWKMRIGIAKVLCSDP
jgi:hypothetical protein